MSSEPTPQGIQLIVKYYGDKAAQHFSEEFTPMSSSVFRQDLSTMKFPLPKTVNTRLAPNATVIALWPDVTHKTHDGLYNHLQKNTNAASSNGLLAQLSILLMLVVEIGAQGQEPRQLAFVQQKDTRISSTQELPPPPKRARHHDNLHSSVQATQQHPRSLPPALPIAETSNGLRSSISSTQSDPTPPPPASQFATRTTSTAQKRSWDGQNISSALPTRPPVTPSFSLLPPPRVPQIFATSTPAQPRHNLPPKPPTGLLPLSPPGVPTAQRAPAFPAQALGQQTTQNRQPTQSPPAPTSTLAVTQSQLLHRTQVSSSIQQRRSTAPAPRNGAAATPSQAAHDNRPKPSPAPVPLVQYIPTANAVQPPLTARSATGSVSNTPGVPRTHLATVANGAPARQSVVPTAPVAPASASATPSQASAGQVSQIAPQKRQNHQPTQLSLALTSTPAVPRTQLPAPHKQQQSTSAPSSNKGFDGSELEVLRTRVKQMEEMSRTQLNVKLRLHQTAKKLQEEQEARMKSEATAAAAQENDADANRRLEDLQKLLEEEVRRRSEADELLAAARRDGLSCREMYDQAKQERDELARACDHVEENLSFSRRNEDAKHHELNRVLQRLQWMEQELQAETDQHRRYQDLLAGAESNEAALKQRCDDAAQEVASLTRMRDRDAHDALAAKRRDDEALRRCEEKLLTQHILRQQAEDAMHGAQSSEKALRRRLEEVESRLEEVQSGLEAELGVERRMRREAEDAIADIRRECREPFVVPSLLDAFVELAKLTTAATTSDGLAMGTDAGNLENKNSDGIPSTSDSTMDAASGDAGAVAAPAEWPHEQQSPFSPHFSPRASRYSPLSPQHNLRAPQLKVSNPPDVAVHTESRESQIKFEPE